MVGLVGLVIASGLAVRLIIEHDGDPTIFASFGEDAVEITSYAEEQLGRQVVTRQFQGHDGRFFFVLANDPLLLNPEEHAVLLDRPRYRAQRMFYPLLAGGGGLFGAESVVWSLVIVNVIAMGLGTWAVAALAADMGGSPWWGLSFVLNVGLMSEMNIAAAGVVAAAAGFSSLVFLRRQRLAPGVALLAVGALSREAMLVFAAGCSWWLWRKGRRREAAVAFGVPTLLVLVWAMYVRVRLGPGADLNDIEELGWPFVGLIQAFDRWLADPVDLVIGLAVLLLLVLFARRILLSDEIVGWATVGFIPLTLLLTRQVWLNHYDITRAIAPILTAFVLLAFVSGAANEAMKTQPRRWARAR